MRKIILISLLTTGFLGISQGQGHDFFEKYFHDETMRVDYEHLGDAESEIVVLDRIYRQAFWPGSRVHMIDTFNYGYFRYRIFDLASQELIFSRDFSSNYGEYKVTPQAKQGILKSFHESALFPVPRNKFLFKLEVRNRQNEFETLLAQEIDPDSRQVIKGEEGDPEVIVFSTQYKGDSHGKVDVVYVAEGYTAGEIRKFEMDLNRFTESLFVHEPLKSNRDKFNVWGVFRASPESGVDQPRHHSFKNTNVGASFNSFDMERYLLIEDNKALRDIASHAPYDAIFVLVNHERYGGAGMYNLYCTMTSDNEHSDFLMVHEFGHSFFGLADEYYTSEVGFEDIYGDGYEPIEANITAMSDPAHLKWGHLVEAGTPLPTPWDKEGYDAADTAWQLERKELKEQIARLEREGAEPDAIEQARAEFRVKDMAHAKKMYDWLHTGPFANRVGAFEGAGYISNGMFRPMMDCIMFTKKADSFCAVCRESMQKVIDWYTE